MAAVDMHRREGDIWKLFCIGWQITSLGGRICLGGDWGLRETMTDYNATNQTFVVKDFVIYGFRKCLHEGLLLGGVDDSKSVEDLVKMGKWRGDDFFKDVLKHFYLL